MIEISIKENLDWTEDETYIKRILRLFIENLFEGERSLSVYITDDAEIRVKNQKERGLNHPTDILSWSYFEEDPDAELIGELMVSLDRIRTQAAENGWDIRTELVRLLAHGCVHLAGWNHERSEEEAQEMLKLEIQLLHRAGFEKLYP